MEDDLIEKFRKEAMREFGYGKGAISKAGSVAIMKWLEEIKKSRERKKKRELIISLEKAFGTWTGEEGVKFTRRLRDESEERLKRMGL